MKNLFHYLFLITFLSSEAQNNKIGKDRTRLYPVLVGHTYGYINNSGTIVIKPQFDKAEYFFDGLAEIELSGKYGFIDTTGKIIINPKFEKYIRKFSEGLAIIDVGGKKGYINTKGEVVIQPQFYDARNFSEGLALVANDQIYLNSWGYIDKKGEFIIPPIYGDGDDFKME